MDPLENETAIAQARSILGPTKETEFLQSFVRVGITDEEEEPPPKSTISHRVRIQKSQIDTLDNGEKSSTVTEKPLSQRPVQKDKIQKKKIKKKIKREEELYTDKDRAAAVVMGCRDIKQSLNVKEKMDKTKALHLPETTDSHTLIALSRSEVKAGRHNTALHFIDKALELSPDDKQALVARSKCYLLLGEPTKALEDAESALNIDKNFVKAIFQKAEALYYSGEFEHSLMHYHRGARMRPDLEGFRLGIQKAQEAIENTIGASKANEKSANTKKSQSEPKSSRTVLSQLMSDKIYLENLLKNPNLCIADRKNDTVIKQAEEAIKFLENRAEFWRQQEASGLE